MKTNIWNIILSTIGTAIIGLLGYVLITLNSMQQASARRDALDFNSKDAAALQRDLTEIMTDIDLRIRLIERDLFWIRAIPNLAIEEEGPTQIPSPPPKDIAPEPPRYKLDSVRQQAQEEY